MQLAAATGLHAENRVALVIGNGAYQNVSYLPNPINDAADLSASLRRLGFTVKTVINAKYDDMRRALIDFDQMATGADVALIYFAGHGMEMGGENWLIPIDAQLVSDRSVPNEAIPLQSLTRVVSGASTLGLVILDACRSNPFFAKMRISDGRRAVERGFSRVEPANRVLVAYSALAGTTAKDGSGRNSPYTEALLGNIEAPGLEVRKLFARLRDQVMAATGNEQQPVAYESLPEKDIFLGASGPAQPAPVTRPDDALWAAIRESKVTGFFEEFLRAFPDSSHAAAARARIDELSKAQLALAVPGPPSQSNPVPLAARKVMGLDVAVLSDELRARYRIKPNVKGVVVTAVDAGSDAADKRIAPGDVIVEMAMEAVSSGADTTRLFDKLTKDGKKTAMLLLSNGSGELRFVALALVAGSQPPPVDRPADKAGMADLLGLDLSPLSGEMRSRYKIKDGVKGVVITAVAAGSDAADKRLTAGDILVEVAQSAVSSAADVKTRLDRLRKDGKKSVLLLVSNAGGELRFVALGLQ